MVCPKLEKGNCKVTKNKCKKSYLIKMILWTKCLVFKKGKLIKQPIITKKPVKRKADLNDRLAVRGLYIPEYKPDYDYMRKSILFAMYSVLTLQSEFLHTKRKPNLKFLSERKDYKWDDPTIDIFERMGDLS